MPWEPHPKGTSCGVHEMAFSSRTGRQPNEYADLRWHVPKIAV